MTDPLRNTAGQNEKYNKSGQLERRKEKNEGQNSIPTEYLTNSNPVAQRLLNLLECSFLIQYESL